MTNGSAAWALTMLVGMSYAVTSAPAIPLTFGVAGADTSSDTGLVPSMRYDLSGSSLIVTLTDPSAGPGRTRSNAPPEVLFNVAGTSTLTSSNDAETAYEGYHESATCDAISGWAWSPQQPDAPIDVHVYDDRGLLVTISANQARRDLVDAGKGNGAHGFTLPLPASLKDGKAHEIRVKVGRGLDLASTPKVITCAPPPDSK